MAHPLAPATAPDGDVVWTDPPKWVRLPQASPMRKATYQIPFAPGDPENAELAVFFFGSDQGGSVEDNVKRWVGQFQSAPGATKRREKSMSPMKQWIVETEGAYMGSGMNPGQASGPKPNFALLGAIVETPVGKYFFKMTGPKKTVQGARGDFQSLIDSVKMK
jgi:hypothetical protein